RRWWEMRKRADQLVGFLDDTVAVQADAMPWLHRELPPAATDVPAELDRALSPLTGDLLRSVLTGRPGASGLGGPGGAHAGDEPERITATANVLRSAASVTDDNGRFLLAVLAEPWMRRHDERIGPLMDMLERRDALKSGLSQLIEADRDVDEIELSLLD